ncbi:hypothetical protein TIFTF001_005740 [Ficus carica]|uniref:Inosine/uridine-preferring nucleoside hydrolase domain-containing protein n=1 Tax=Ficus carica TaxID=3494 RepID=A0AA88CXZ3_FICCA|nr:hypothetical protein TIFTF001_005740 [Ficus carica]
MSPPIAAAPPKKIIIDTDPGIDDTMAILVALRSPEVEVIGLTTIFGNVYTSLATRNALHLNGTKLRIADFVHGVDGLGNQNFPPPKGKPIPLSAPAFLVQQANLYPRQLTLVALGPLTNIALAIQLDPAFAKNIGQIVVLGGAFSVNGNVNPAAEANIFGDPEAADIVFTSGADLLTVGLNVTHQVMLTAVNPSLMTYTEGVVRVQTSGITRGLTILYNKQKRFGEMTEWSDKPAVKVAVTVDAPTVVRMVMERLMDLDS